MTSIEKRAHENVREDQGSSSASEQRNQMNPAIATFNCFTLVSQIENEETWKNRDRSAITLSRSHGLQITLIAMHSGTSKPWHRVECPISIQVIEGKIEFITDAEVVPLKKGDILILQEGIRHHMKAIEESVILLTLASI